MRAHRWLTTAGMSLMWLFHAPAGAQALPPSLFKPELLLPRVEVAKAHAATPLPTGRSVDIKGVSYAFQGQTRTVGEFLSEAKVKGFVVLKDGQVVYEYSRFPHGRTSLHQSWSMMKQVLSTLVGIAIAEGRIASVDDRMDRYEPKLALNGFAGVTFRQALLMTSGVKYDEEKDRYSLFFDVIQDAFLGAKFGQSLEEKVTDPSLTVAYPPGSRYEYASINSQAIAWALEAAIHMPLADYLQTRLWEPLGMTDGAKLLVDRARRPFTFCCLYATTRSYARFGQLYAQQGRWNGQQVVPSDWVRRSTTFADPLSWKPSQVPRDGEILNLHGWAYHWWPLVGTRGDFTASGVFGQGVHVLPAQNTVIARNADDFDVPGGRAEEAIVMGRAIADHLERP